MTTMYDLVIRGGTIVDGSGEPEFAGDVAVRDGKIAAVGEIPGLGREEIDASGQLVTPGFVDIHTHYDGQASWGGTLTPSSLHGVTTAVMGNCGVGFAPCRPADHDLLIRLMEGIEDIPQPVLSEGLKWNWESFPEFLDMLEEQPHDIDFAAQLPHGPLRVYVMGKRGADREPASPADRAEMARLAGEAVAAGALGFTTSRTLNHRTKAGQLAPTMDAEGEELVEIARALGERGQGVLQLISDFTDRDAEMAIVRRMTAESGRPISFTVLQTRRSQGGWRDLLADIAQANADGLDVKGQVCGRPVGVLLGLEVTFHPFSAHPSFREIADLPHSAQAARMAEPGFKARLLAEQPDPEDRFIALMMRNFHELFPLSDPPEYEPHPSTSIAAQAEARGVSPFEIAYELIMADAGHGMIYYAFANYADGNLDAALEMMQHPNTILGLGDGGAHVGVLCDASFTTHMLTHWTRDRSRGERLSLPWVIKAYTRDTAAAVGLNDRGLLAPGYKADINIIDYDNLSLRRPTAVFDLPSGGRRLMQTADGYTATIVSGKVIYRNGVATGALPGKLVRGAQATPNADPAMVVPTGAVPMGAVG